MIDTISGVLRAHRFRFSSELQLQDGIENALRADGVVFERERQLGHDRVDFFAGGVALEVKVDGSLSAVTRQLHKYAQHPDVSAVVLATTRMLHDRMPAEMCGKPVRVVVLRTGAF